MPEILSFPLLPPALTVASWEGRSRNYAAILPDNE
jgi:hypothetical protein